MINQKDMHPFTMGRSRWRKVSSSLLIAMHFYFGQAHAEPITFQRDDQSIYASAPVSFGKNGVFLVGQVYDESGPGSWGWLARIESNATLHWEKEFGKKAQSAYFSAGTMLGDGKIILVGTANQKPGPAQMSQPWVAAVDENGRILWDKSLPVGPQAHALDVKQIKPGNVLILGTTREQDRDQVWVRKMDPAGHEYMNAVLAIANGVVPRAIAPSPGGGFFVYGKIFDPDNGQAHGWVGRFAADGKLLWTRTIALRHSDVTSLLDAENGSVILAYIGQDEGSVRTMQLDQSGGVISEHSLEKLASCQLPALWRDLTGVSRVAAFCPAHDGHMWIGVLRDAEHQGDFTRIGPLPVTQITGIFPVPELNSVMLIGVQRDNSGTRTWFDAFSLP